MANVVGNNRGIHVEATNDKVDTPWERMNSPDRAILAGGILH